MAVGGFGVLVLGRLIGPPHMEGVAVFRYRNGIRVCARQPVHNCIARLGTSSRRDRILGPIPTIQPTASCDTHESAANERCDQLGIQDLYDPVGRATRLGCLAGLGIVDGEIPTLSRLSDPRDSGPTLPANEAQVRCDEGEILGSFSDEGY